MREQSRKGRSQIGMRRGSDEGVSLLAVMFATGLLVTA